MKPEPQPQPNPDAHPMWERVTFDLLVDDAHDVVAIVAAFSAAHGGTFDRLAADLRKQVKEQSR